MRTFRRTARSILGGADVCPGSGGSRQVVGRAGAGTSMESCDRASKAETDGRRSPALYMVRGLGRGSLVAGLFPGQCTRPGLR